MCPTTYYGGSPATNSGAVYDLVATSFESVDVCAGLGIELADQIRRV